MAAEPWFVAGLRFCCQGCGGCCSGAPGAVWVEAEDIDRLARQFELSADQFERTYVRRQGLRSRLYEWPNGDCVFYASEERRCLVYDARPRQCRCWPFWRANVDTKESWSEVVRICPGAGRGKAHSFRRIRDLMDR